MISYFLVQLKTQVMFLTEYDFFFKVEKSILESTN